MMLVPRVVHDPDGRKIFALIVAMNFDFYNLQFHKTCRLCSHRVAWKWVRTLHKRFLFNTQISKVLKSYCVISQEHTVCHGCKTWVSCSVRCSNKASRVLNGTSDGFGTPHQIWADFLDVFYSCTRSCIPGRQTHQLLLSSLSVVWAVCARNLLQ